MAFVTDPNFVYYEERKNREAFDGATAAIDRKPCSSKINSAVKSVVDNCNIKNNKYNLDYCTTNVCLPPSNNCNFNSTYKKLYIFKCSLLRIIFFFSFCSTSF